MEMVGKMYIATHLKLSKDEQGVTVEQSLYKRMICSLLCLTANHIDITFSIDVCARFQDNPKITHLTQVKRIIKYICGIYDYGLLYSFDTTSSLVGYCDTDWEEAEYSFARSKCIQSLWSNQKLK